MHRKRELWSSQSCSEDRAIRNTWSKYRSCFSQLLGCSDRAIRVYRGGVDYDLALEVAICKHFSDDAVQDRVITYLHKDYQLLPYMRAGSRTDEKIISDFEITSAIVAQGTPPSSTKVTPRDKVRLVKFSAGAPLAVRCFWRFLAMFKPIEPSPIISFSSCPILASFFWPTYPSQYRLCLGRHGSLVWMYVAMRAEDTPDHDDGQSLHVGL